MAMMRSLVWMAVGVVMVGGCSLPEKKETSTPATKEQIAKAEAENAITAPTPRILPETYVAAGRMLEEQKNFADAVVQYEKAISINPHCVPAYNQLGLLYQKTGRFPDAELVFRRGIQAEPNVAILRNNIGYCFLSQERYTEAERQFREALTIDPAFKRARMNLAIVLGQTGRDAESLQEFSTVVPAEVAYFNLAMIKFGKQSYADAEAALVKALSINPDCPGAKIQLDRARILAKSEGVKPAQPDAKRQAVAGAVEPAGEGEP
jgi:Flp pilus assembly protein TadD